MIVYDTEKNYHDYRIFTFLACWITAFCVSCFSGLFQPFMKLWMGKDALVERKYQYGLNLYYVRADCAKASIYERVDGHIQRINYVYRPAIKQLNPLGDAEWLKP